MDTSKSKLQVKTGKTESVKLGTAPSTSGSSLKPAAKKDYSKNKKVEDFGTTGFGQTGLTGES